MANPKTKGIAGPDEPQMCCKEQLRRVAPAQMFLAKMGRNGRFPGAVTGGKDAVGTTVVVSQCNKGKSRRGKADGISPCLLISPSPRVEVGAPQDIEMVWKRERGWP